MQDKQQESTARQGDYRLNKDSVEKDEKNERETTEAFSELLGSYTEIPICFILRE